MAEEDILDFTLSLSLVSTFRWGWREYDWCFWGNLFHVSWKSSHFSAQAWEQPPSPLHCSECWTLFGVEIVALIPSWWFIREGRGGIFKWWLAEMRKWSKKEEVVWWELWRTWRDGGSLGKWVGGSCEWWLVEQEQSEGEEVAWQELWKPWREWRHA